MTSTGILVSRSALNVLIHINDFTSNCATPFVTISPTEGWQLDLEQSVVTQAGASHPFFVRKLKNMEDSIEHLGSAADWLMRCVNTAPPR